MHPTAPAVPVGLSTKVGLASSAVLGVVAALAAILDGDHSAETIAALVTAAFVLYGVIRSRGDQAAALYANNAPVEADDTLHPSLEGVPVGPIPAQDEGDGEAAG